MPKTYSDLITEVKQVIKTVSLAEVKRRLEAKEPMLLVDVREKDEFRDGLHPGRGLAPARLPRDAGRAEAARQERADRRLLRRRHALGVRRQDAAELGYTHVESRQPRLRALEGPRLPGREAGPPDRRAARSLLAAPPPARGGRGGPGEAAQGQGAAARRRRARSARRRSTSRRRAWARSASSTPTRSTRRTCSARSSTPRARVGTPKVESAAEAHRAISTPT